LTGHSYACNSLTNFESEALALIRNRNGESTETCKEKLVKSHEVNLFLAGFIRLEPLCCAFRASYYPVYRLDSKTLANI
jgi:hypothetical protein